MKKISGLAAVLCLLASLLSGSVLAENIPVGHAKPAGPSVEVSLNNNPKITAAWRDSLYGGGVDVSNTPGIMVNGHGFKNGRKPLAVYFRGQIAAKGEVAIASGTFSALLTLGGVLTDPREVEVRIGEDFSQKAAVRLRRLRGTIKRKDGASVPYPLVTNGLFRGSDFYLTAVGDKKGGFEIFLPDTVSTISIFEDNFSKVRLECGDYELPDGPPMAICMEPHLVYSADKAGETDGAVKVNKFQAKGKGNGSR